MMSINSSDSLDTVDSRALGKADVAAFCVASLSFSMFDVVRHQVQRALHKLKLLVRGIAKHSTPVSFVSLRKYLFQNDNAADRVTLMGGLMNLVLSAGKLVVGVACHSSALIADAGHSLSDLFSDLITLWAVQVGRLPPDDDHPYGHGKFEAIGALFLALTLLGTGLSVGAMSNRKLLHILRVQRAEGFQAAAGLVEVPTAPALFVAGLSIVSKEWLFRVTRQVGEKLNSQVVLANAWHHRTDAYSSVLTLIAIALAMVFPGLIAADSAAGILVAGMICLTGTEILFESIQQLTDTNNQDLVNKITKLASRHDDVHQVNRVRARQVGSKSMVDVSITTETDLVSSASRTIEEQLRMRILQEPGVVDAEVHAPGPPEVAQHHHHNYLHPNSDSAPQPETLPTAAQVESHARDMLQEKEQFEMVQGITVYYQDAVKVTVDVDLRLEPDMTGGAGESTGGRVAGVVGSGGRDSQGQYFFGSQ